MAKTISFGGTFANKNKKTTGGNQTMLIKTVKIDYGDGPKNLEKDAVTELTALQVEFKAKAKHEAALKDKNTNTEFYSVIIFKTEDQREEFFEQIGYKSDEPEGTKYVNGEKLIDRLKLNIQKVDLKNPGKFKCNKEIANLATKIKKK